MSVTIELLVSEEPIPCTISNTSVNIDPEFREALMRVSCGLELNREKDAKGRRYFGLGGGIRDILQKIADQL